MESIDLTKLREPFPARDIEWRVQASGNSGGKIWARVLAYITNRAIQERLDAVVGVENWRNEYQKAPDGGVMCGLSIRINGEWVTKWDGAENTDIEGVKGGLSNAMKRAGVQWGIGRYLYDLEADYATISPDGEHYAQTKDKTPFKWDPPALPAWALPAGEKPKVPRAKAQDIPPIDPPAGGRTAEEINELVILKESLINYLNHDPPVFRNADAVQGFMDRNDLPNMRKALSAAKSRAAEPAAKESA